MRSHQKKTSFESGKYNRNQIMKLNTKTLRLVGLWRTFPSSEGHDIRGKVLLMYGILLCLIQFINVTSGLIGIVYAWGDFKKFANVGCITLTYVAALVKQVVFLVRYEKIVHLVQIMQTGFLSTSLNWSPEQGEILIRNLRHAKIVTWIYYSFGISTVIIFETSALLKSFPETFGLAEDLSGNQTVRSLLFEAWYPFDIKKPGNFKLALSFQFFISTFGPVVNIGIDTFIVSLIICYCAHFKILKHSLRTISRRVEESYAKEEDTGNSKRQNPSGFGGLDFSDSVSNPNKWKYSEMYEKEYSCLRECIQHHQILLLYVTKMEDVFDIVFFAQFLSSTCTICLDLFYIAENLDTDGVLGVLDFLIFLAISFLQVLLFCWYGHQLMYQSDSVSKAMYDSPWYESSLKFKKSLCFMMERAAKPTYLTGSKFYIVSLETFRAILGASFSYYTVLRNLNSM